MLAAKFEELDMNIPMNIDLQIANKFKITYQQLKGVEQELLLILDFDLMALTPLHFLRQLVASGLLMSSDSKGSGKDISEKTLVKIKEYAYFFCEAANEHYKIIQQFQPSKVAAACIYIARQCCQLSDVWSINLEEYTGYTALSLKDVVGQFSRDLGKLITYVINNFREGNSLRLNKFKNPVD